MLGEHSLIVCGGTVSVFYCIISLFESFNTLGLVIINIQYRRNSPEVCHCYFYSPLDVLLREELCHHYIATVL